MKTTTVRQLRHAFGSVIHWVEEGEEVEIKKRGKVVAVISPPKSAKRRKVRWPDFAARLKARDGGKVYPDIIAAERESYDR